MRSVFTLRVCALPVLIGFAAVFGSSTAEAQTVDGTIGAGEYGSAASLQDTQTHFGNNISELDAMYARLQPGGDLSVGLTGNLEPNGNGIVLLIDSKAGGCVTSIDANGYGVIGSIPGRYTDDLGTDTDGSAGVSPTPAGGSKLPPGFNPDYAIEMNNNDGLGGASYFINVIDLTLTNDPPANPSDPDNRDFGIGSNITGGPAVTQSYIHGSITHAFDNSNTAGVNDYNDPTLGDPSSATTGLEMRLSSDFLQTNLSSIRLMAFITNGGGDFLSNQFLPGLGGSDNLGGPGFPGGDPMFDASSLTTISDVVVTVPEPGSLAFLSLIAIGLWQRRRKE